ncbi:DNA-directed RNA polymerase sigma-70 factor [Filimonas zeae]|uniref:DNA-directed RNA polymerase sigma-70 factor n=2 Tax=Filimonas zeae TaxID=1737353 RepID=A0A917MYG1_9BACT|nr:DNA-directed RNA polymerase sigma-70 factor [Filimonas zeae]
MPICGQNISSLYNFGSVMTTLDNNELIQALRNGDETVFQQLYDQYSAAVFRNIFRLLPRQQDAEDLLQSVFLKLWESRHRLAEEQTVDGWLFSTSFYLTMNRLRAIARDRLKDMGELPADIPDITETETVSETYMQKMTLLHKAVNLLPARKKQAFELCKMEGKSYQEAAVLLGVSEDTVKDYVKSAMGLLRRQALQTDLLVYALLTLYSANATS